ncbi:putative P-loop containing nucleoside triphosphate hydrolase, leucine-rich repeat domain, L [Medicago truncatula]|uniref:Putative P-loop containing nucleoside triphosphate hydrolase, leucine-rich repeat domain, L n=1 Tax=Medicago truncatula TaxID=3880 RepID=A0A396ISU8_MEDTR|nr:putative disease resistance RPP13-like protein 1 [Medicago truncatula]XP_039688096.1 putative disease resistance RPP13-like protein 1 [Medicago truncatula]XP_039688097.1 putative disease resistance RPP13-like protein 1 [Medicago truncatula]XP_039688098.1 putative disease resistance RPP13-like protein 1 [Medicago truncatula]XP_039688099.1 putative disease resistance RPP13-like protein 1 [Medicago truncatula]RHN66017.1 putative P-loop containing nucleoside triphosphate hydrolase, leucine-rich
MAELIAGAFLSSLFQVTLESIASRDFKDLFNQKLVENLEITLYSINQLLDDAETKKYQNQNVKKWFDRLKHEVYEVDQLLDEIATNAQQKRKVKRLLSTLSNQFESRIKDLLDKLKSLAAQKDVLGLTQSNEGGVSLQSSKRSPTASLVDESCIYGREGDKEEIINYLLSDKDNNNQVSIISIVGMGGMGKTTLAQLVYNDQRMEKHFELKAWVHVSKSFDVVGLTKTILRSFHSPADGEDLDPLICQLQKTLTGKKCLLVLDDVWNGNEECLEQLLLSFNPGFSGSKIIVTTRDKHVAFVMKSDHQLLLNQLEEKDCWSIFVKHAFRGKNVFEYPNLESIGKKIVEKCGGLPLAVKTLGNLLQRKFSQAEWFKILETDMWHVSKGGDEINSVLRLSYHNLPSNLKRCFAFCSIFPKGYVFEKDELIKLWMAEGLLKCCGRDKSEEELGNEFLDDLESISFFQEPLYSWGDKRLFMHDLVNDLAKSESHEFCLQIEGDSLQDITERTRHICCHLDLKDGARLLNHISKIKKLRSFLVVSRGYDEECFIISNNLQHDLFSKLKYLRLLSFGGCKLKELSGEIGNLKLLRYLNLTKSLIERLPDSICKLYKLETLILERCSELTILPSKFYKLVSLRHLNLKGCNIKKMPKQMGSLNHLQTLSHFVVGEENGSNIQELGNLNRLQGKLCISGLEYVINPEDAARANLKDKKHVEELNMKYSDNFKFNINRRESDVIEALQPNSNLKRLTIEGYNGRSFPNWITGCHLPNLVSLQLLSCGLCSHLPPLGQLPSLKELSISKCDGIKIIGEEFHGNNNLTNVPFLSLEVLKFEMMNNWEEWLCLEGFPLLKKLSIRNCPKLKRALPQHLPYLQKLNISDCNKMEASIPKCDNMIELDIQRCDRILVNELPTSLKWLFLCDNPYTEFSVDQNLINILFLEELKLDFRGCVNCPSLDLRCYNSLCYLSITGWGSSSLPFSLHLFTKLHSLYLHNCPELESFPMGGLPSNLRHLKICNCPKLIGSREEWGLFQLNSLDSFFVSDEFENVESFPEENLLPPSLTDLNVINCSKLRIMNKKGFLHLKSLNWLYINNCPSLESLPEKEDLPNSLSNLWIEDCGIIKEKYEKEGGERWHTITHIPNVWIDNIKQK